MTNVIKYVTDEFLENFKVNFKTDYLSLYKTNNKEEIAKIFSNPENVHESSTNFEYVPLKLEVVEGEAIKENIRTLWNSLKHISISEAESEKMWVALANTYYIDYHLNQLKLISAKDKDRSIESRTIFNQGHKRSLTINNLSLLWWVAYYTVDVQHPSNPFHLTDFFIDGAFRGNAVIWFSSNIVSNKDISLGILDAIKELTEQNKMIVNRYSYSNANKILNQIGGVRMLDMLTREEVKEIICANLLDTEKIRVPQMQ